VVSYDVDPSTSPLLHIEYTPSSAPPEPPTVSTQAVTNIGNATATGNGNVVDDGRDTITERGVCYSTVTNPTTANSKATAPGTTGAFTADLTGLASATLYFVKAYAVNSYGTSYGAEVNFTTNSACTVTTQAASAIGNTTATGNGNITSTGGANATRRGFCYKLSISGDPTVADTVAYDDGSYGTGAYTKAIAGLTKAMPYRIRSYTINPSGTSYGSTLGFYTTGVRAYNLRGVSDSKGRYICNAKCTAFSSGGVAVEIQYTDNTGSAAFVSLPDTDPVDILVSYGITAIWYKGVLG
jgi:hypothetical protein